MNVVTRVLKARLGEGSMDAWLSRWGCVLGGALVAGVASATLRQYATGRAELVVGSAAAAVAGLLLVLLGEMARRVHLAVEAGLAPWRARRWELLGHAAGLLVLGAGGWALADAAADTVAAVTGALLVLSAYAAVLCLGCWSTVARSVREAPVPTGRAAAERP